MAAIDTATMTNADIASALKTCDAEHLKVAETSTKLMLGILLLPALGVCCFLMPVAPMVAAGGLAAGLLGALGCWVGSEAYNMRALALEKDIEALGDESARRYSARNAKPEYAAALSSQLSPPSTPRSADWARTSPSAHQLPSARRSPGPAKARRLFEGYQLRALGGFAEIER